MPEELLGLHLHVHPMTAIKHAGRLSLIALADDTSHIDVPSGHITRLQPLAHEILNHAISLPVLQHAVDLLPQVLTQLSFRRETQ